MGDAGGGVRGQSGDDAEVGVGGGVVCGGVRGGGDFEGGGGGVG